MRMAGCKLRDKSYVFETIACTTMCSSGIFNKVAAVVHYANCICLLLFKTPFRLVRL